MTTLPNIASGVDPSTGLLIFLVAVFGGTLSANSISNLLSKVWKKRHRKVADADERAEKMLEQAREESLAIIKSAHEQARKILAETETVSSQINDLAHSAIQTSMKEKSKLLEDSLVKLQEQFAVSLGGIQSDYINRYKKAIKTIEEDAGSQVQKMREFFEAETSSTNDSLQSMTKEGLKIVQSNLEGYERDQKTKVDTIIYTIIKQVTEDVLGKGLSLEGHQDLITKAIEDAKKENAFN